MSMLGTTTKAKLGSKALRTAVRRPGLAQAGFKAARPGIALAMPIARRRARRRADATFASALSQPLLDAARQLGLVDSRVRQKRTAPRFVAGVAVGAAGTYLLEADHREELMKLVSRS